MATTRCAADACFNVADIVLLIAEFIGTWDKAALSRFSKTNHCTYLSLEQLRSRVVSCLDKRIPSLSLFLERQLLRHEQLSCHSLEIISNESFMWDGTEVDTNPSLISIFNHFAGGQTLESFSYRASNPRQSFLTVSPPAIWDALQVVRSSLKNLNITSHPCDWMSLFVIDFTEMRNLQLALNFSCPLLGCKRPNFVSLISGDSPELDAFLSSSKNSIFRFLRGMPHITNLVLSLQNFKTENLDMNNVHIPTLAAIDLTSDAPPLGVTRFAARHPELLRLHLRFGKSPAPEPFSPRDLTKLRALKLREDDIRMFALFLMKRAESLEGPNAQHPYIDHFLIYSLRSFTFLVQFVMPFRRQIRRLDLQPYDEKPIFHKAFLVFLKSCTALVELSITITSQKGRVSEQSVLHLRLYLAACKDCTSLKAIHLYDVLSPRLDAYEMKTIKVFPPSLQYISWGGRGGKTTYRVIRDTRSESTRVVACEVPPAPDEIVYDWTSRNTFRHLFD